MEEIFIILALILLNGVFAMSEISVISARKQKLLSEAEKGSKRARKALLLQDNPDNFLSSVQVGITLIGLLTGMFSGNKIAAIFSDTLVAMGMTQSAASILAQTIIIIVVTFLSIVLGELVPKRIGMNAAESVAKLMAGPMHTLSKITRPVVWILSKSTAAIVRIMGIKPQEAKVTEEEIKYMVQEGTEDGEVLPVEQDIVERVFRLGDLRVSTIMTPRSEIVWIEQDMSEQEIREIIQQSVYDEYPVASNDLDHVIGTISLKDYVTNKCDGKFCIREKLGKAEFFHEDTNVYHVLESMKQKKIGRALICDEFGHCSGLITHKDILEALVGDMQDADEVPDIVERKDGHGWLVEGQCNIIDFLTYFDIDEETDDCEYSTIAGLIIDQIGRLPELGEKLEWNGLELEIVDMDGPRIDKVLVKKK